MIKKTRNLYVILHLWWISVRVSLTTIRQRGPQWGSELLTLVMFILTLPVILLFSLLVGLEYDDAERKD